jgi:hypothetical protein
MREKADMQSIGADVIGGAGMGTSSGASAEDFLAYASCAINNSPAQLLDTIRLDADTHDGNHFELCTHMHERRPALWGRAAVSKLLHRMIQSARDCVGIDGLALEQLLVKGSCDGRAVVIVHGPTDVIVSGLSPCHSVY